MSKLTILHLSDIHIGSNQIDPEGLAISIGDILIDNENSIDNIIISGDIFYKGKKDIDGCLRFFNKLIDKISSINNKISSSDFIFVPGNHDIDRNQDDQYSSYSQFLAKFHKIEDYQTFYNDNFFSVRIFEDKKVVIIGLNSNQNSIIEDIDQKTGNEGIYRGNIPLTQIDDAFALLKKNVDKIEDYNIIATFHHHFYLFPENFEKFKESIIINFSEVINSLQRYKVKIVLHGHKHIPINRAITDKNYFFYPESIIYAFAAGSIGDKGIPNRSFQVVDIFPPQPSKIAEVRRYTYTLDQSPEKATFFPIPPIFYDGKGSGEHLEEIFKTKWYLDYIEYSREFDNKYSQFHGTTIAEIIKAISAIITPYSKILYDLEHNPYIIEIIFLIVHYRVIFLEIQRNHFQDNNNIIDVIEDRIKGFNLGIESHFWMKIFELLRSESSQKIEFIHSSLYKENKSLGNRRIVAYSTITLFITDLYLSISKYGDYYYENELVDPNITLHKYDFTKYLPFKSIQIESNIDKRSIPIRFTCENPSVHQIAVLIIKEFEKLLDKLEESFKELEIKAFYLLPIIIKNGYDLENYNFEAYVPKLLPLLIGENLYRNKEVFARELIQNSADAILLRKELENSEKNLEIIIKFGEEPHQVTGEIRKFMEISDNGTGMNLFQIERYFTSIGRSFYVSNEFRELSEKKKIEYQPISNFGIGFLSSFIVAKEIEVETRHFCSEDGGLKIIIPNYDGAFFISQKENIPIGTKIKIYSNDKKYTSDEGNNLKGDSYFNEINIINYIKKTFLDFRVKISIFDSSGFLHEIHPHQCHDKELCLFLPIDSNGMLEDISWLDCVKNKNCSFSHGLRIQFLPQMPSNFVENDHISIKPKFLNEGINVYESQIQIFSQCERCIQYYNLPASMIELDVSRDNICNFKEGKGIDKDRALRLLAKQASELMKDLIQRGDTEPIETLLIIYKFFQTNTYSGKIIGDNLFSLSFISNPNLNRLLEFKRENPSYLSPSNVNYLKNILRILLIAKIIEKSNINFDSAVFGLRVLYNTYINGSNSDAININKYSQNLIYSYQLKKSYQIILNSRFYKNFDENLNGWLDAKDSEGLISDFNNKLSELIPLPHNSKKELLSILNDPWNSSVVNYRKEFLSQLKYIQRRFSGTRYNLEYDPERLKLLKTVIGNDSLFNNLFNKENKDFQDLISQLNDMYMQSLINKGDIKKSWCYNYLQNSNEITWKYLYLEAIALKMIIGLESYNLVYSIINMSYMLHIITVHGYHFLTIKDLAIN